LQQSALESLEMTLNSQRIQLRFDDVNTWKSIGEENGIQEFSLNLHKKKKGGGAPFSLIVHTKNFYFSSVDLQSELK
jgi:excinuclease UvrABC helicase subunit UvrB